MPKTIVERHRLPPDLGGGASNASDVAFDNTGTDLASTNAQDAIIELNDKIGNVDIDTVPSDKIMMSKDFPVRGTSWGNYGDGSNIPALTNGWNLNQMLDSALTVAVHPTYTAPNASLSGNPAPATREVGQSLAITLSSTFNRNDAGAATGSFLTKNSAQQAVTFPVNDTIVLSTSNVTYIASWAYAQGAVKNNNLGQPDATGQIQAGSVNSSTLTYRGWYKEFWDATAIPTSSAQVRAAANNRYTNAGNTWIINTGNSSTTIWFWLPAGVTLVGVIDLDALNAVVNYSSSAFSVNDAGGNPVSGTLHTLTLSVAYSSNHRHQVTVQ